MAHIKQRCDFCFKPATYDAMTTRGPWAFMCDEHFERLALKAAGTYKRLEPVEVTKKVCSVCGKEKLIGEFYQYTDNRGVRRFRTECKECNLAARKIQRFKKG